MDFCSIEQDDAIYGYELHIYSASVNSFKYPVLRAGLRNVAARMMLRWVDMVSVVECCTIECFHQVKRGCTSVANAPSELEEGALYLVVLVSTDGGCNTEQKNM